MMNKYSIGFRISAGISILLVLLIGIIVPVIVQQIDSLIHDAEERELKGLYENVSAAIQAEARVAQVASALVARIPQVSEAFSKGDRPGLKALLVPTFATLKNDYGVRQFQFHTPPATSFLRVHKPAKFGDDLASFRKTVVRTNVTKQPVGGIEKGVAGLGVRGMVPVFNNGKHIGSLELGMSFGQPFFDAFKHKYGVELIMHVMADNGLKQFANTMGKASLLSDEQLSGVINQGKKLLSEGNINNTPYAIYAGIVNDFSGQPVGVLEIAMDRSSYVSALNQATYILVAIGIVAILTGLVMAMFIGRSIVNPIKNTVSALQDIAEGEGDLTKRIAVNGKDEIAQLANAFNQFSEKIRAIIIEITAAANQLSGESQSLSDTTIESSNSISRQRSEIEQVATAMNEMTATVQEVARSASEAAASAQQADTQTIQGKTIVLDSVSAIEVLASEVERAASVINEVETDSEQIGSVLDVIRGIAEQTNLLALNAAIEAARAGEQGRGFAVVADEVRTLASRTQESTQEIQDMIEKLQSGTRAAVAVMTEGGEKASISVKKAREAGTSLDNITAAVASISDMNTQIASAAEEQSQVAEEINKNVVTINTMADEVTSNSSRTTDSSQTLSALAQQLTSIVGQFKT
jgi:methyl-accepting chemotaxis protein